jgi:hypothetical protein
LIVQYEELSTQTEILSPVKNQMESGFPTAQEKLKEVINERESIGGGSGKVYRVSAV